MIEGWTVGEKIAGGTVFVTLAGVVIRFGLTILGRQGLISAGDQSQKDLITSLSAERTQWRDLYEKKVSELDNERTQHSKDMDMLRQQHHDNLMLLGEVRLQNRMLRMLLIQRGMSADELDAALELPDSH